MEQTLDNTLRQMGINPSHIGKAAKSATLPPLPASDAGTLQRNPYDGFYQMRAQEMWGQSEVVSEPIEDFKKCQHYLMKHNNEIQCTICHAGWITPPNWTCKNGKLFEQEIELQFAL